MKSIGTAIAESKNKNRPKNISQEFQHYGCYLAESLGDEAHYSLYIKMAKNYSRVILDEALTYTKGYTAAKSKARVFMWRVKQLRDAQKVMSDE